ncbi:ATP-binding protein [candidate division WOR-3 bacterium]|nr:ATP-binding protein [candidate division WOR-3 bacterium]
MVILWASVEKRIAKKLEGIVTKHQSSVNFQNLIRDLADMYPFEVPEVIIVELVANSLDAKATRISIDFDPEKRILSVEDNGQGMDESQFDEYHDFAAGLKRRGTGIGFAGVGAKISFNVAERVVTQTRSKLFEGGSDWRLETKKELVWEEIKPKELKGHGTRVAVYFKDKVKLNYGTTETLIALLRRHYLPLMDSKFLKLYSKMTQVSYSNELRFVINGVTIEPFLIREEFALEKVKELFPERRGQLYGYGIMGIADKDYPFAPETCGILLCTYGKIIKGELFNQFPGEFGPRLFGVVEIPGLVNFITTSKTEFIKSRKHREFEKLYGPIRSEFRTWLKELGVEIPEEVKTQEAKRLERELKKILDDVPELGEFFGFRDKKKILSQNKNGHVNTVTEEGVERTFPDGEGVRGKTPGPLDAGDEPGERLVSNRDGEKRAAPISRTSRRGPKISFAEVPDRNELAWVEGGNIIINSGHSVYRKVQSNNTARRLHNLFSIGSAIQRFLGSEAEKPDLMFVDRMMAAWGHK